MMWTDKAGLLGGDDRHADELGIDAVASTDLFRSGVAGGIRMYGRLSG